jgi:glucokinase
MLLVGDIGGTKTLLETWAAGPDGKIAPVRQQSFPSAAHASLEEIIARYRATAPHEKFEACCFGVAGPIREGRCKVTNLPWEMEEANLAAACGASRAKLLNDLEAMAYGMLYVSPDKFVTLNAARAIPGGHCAVLAAGTGLGQAFLAWDGRAYNPVASEGGHADFAPRSELEVGLWRFLQGKYGSHVSYERILSGTGFHDLFLFLKSTGEFPATDELARRLESGEPQPVISELGLSGRDPLCAKTVDLFCEIYGAEAGNLALKCVGLGGVFVGGGIGPRLRSAMTGGAFLRGFLDKGRFSNHLRSVPVRMTLDPQTPLLGAAHYAFRLSLV